MKAQIRTQERILFVFLVVLALLFLAPILLVLMNSFKGRFFISDTPFAFPNAETFVGMKNYFSGVEKTGFYSCIWLFTFHHRFLGWSHCAVHIHDSLVHHAGQIQIQFHPLFPAWFFP